MVEKIKIEVFGIKDQSSGDGCNCNGNCNCGPTKTMGEMYDEFVRFLLNTNVKERIEFKFTDLLMDNMDENDYVIDAMNQGYGLPLTAINGEIKFYGGISNNLIFEAIKKLV